jgi:hypothetical protein
MNSIHKNHWLAVPDLNFPITRALKGTYMAYINKTKLAGIVLFTIGLHLSAGILDPIAWKVVAVLLVGNLCSNIGSYLMDPEKELHIAGGKPSPVDKAD